MVKAATSPDTISNVHQREAGSGQEFGAKA
jgi:hypothetical protein